MGFSIRKLWRGHTESRHPVESTQPPPFGPSPQTSRWKMLGKIRGTLGGLQKTIQARCENGKMGVPQKKVQENCDKLRDFQQKLQEKTSKKKDILAIQLSIRMYSPKKNCKKDANEILSKIKSIKDNSQKKEMAIDFQKKLHDVRDDLSKSSKLNQETGGYDQKLEALQNKRDGLRRICDVVDAYVKATDYREC